MQSCTQAIAVKLTPPHRMGLATSTFFIFLDAGLGFGPYLLGFIIPLTGYSTLYVILGVVVLASSILYYFLHGKKERASIKCFSSIINKKGHLVKEMFLLYMELVVFVMFLENAHELVQTFLMIC